MCEKLTDWRINLFVTEDNALIMILNVIGELINLKDIEYETSGKLITVSNVKWLLFCALTIIG